MGFITGFVRPDSSAYSEPCELTYSHEQFSGFALTTSLLYISLQVHKAIRLEQRRAIREQVDQINYLAAASGAYDRRFEPQYTPRRLEERPTRRDNQPDMKETLKHRWNQEVEKLARKAHETRWDDVRETATEGWKAAVKFVKKD
jgi:altered-inheritance-of-mitochondria protein 5